MFPVAQLFITCAEFKNIKMADTITFDENNNGWSSRWSYKPEWMSRLNRGFFSFKKGQLYRHHDPMADRNLFYDDNGDLIVFESSISIPFNHSPSDTKHFKSVKLESDTNEWKADISTNLDDGHINQESFDTREGEHYAYIRRDAGSSLNFDHLSIQGIGSLISNVGDVYTFISVPSFISEEDSLYFFFGGTNTLIERIIDFDATTITTDTPAVPPVIPVGSFFFIAKNPVAESNGIKGNHAVVTLTTTSSEEEHVLFSVNSEAFKSNE